MYNERLTQRQALLATINPQSVAAGTADSGAVDMSLIHRVVFWLLTGVLGASATVDAKLQGSANGSTGWTDITGKSITQLVKASNDNNQAAIEISDAELFEASSTFRYVRMRVTVGTASSIVAVVAIGGEPRFLPASNQNPATVVQLIP